MRFRSPALAIVLGCVLAALAGVSAVHADYRNSARWFAAKPESDRLVLQSTLILVGYYNGVIDGVFGKNTYDAITKYQAANRLNADGVLSPDDERQLLAAAAQVYGDLGFTDQTDSATGIQMLVPTKLLTAQRPADFGTHWENADGSVELETLVIPESKTPFARLLRRLSQAGNRRVEYSFVRDSIFVLSGEVDDRKFYTMFVKDGGFSQGFSVSWTPAEDRIGRVVSAFLASVAKFPIAGHIATPGTGEQPHPQPLSSGSGFAISADGVIVTNAHVVEDCVSIDVNGFGSAKRIAVDESSDLAVIRLTGARATAPAQIQSGPLHLGQAVVALGYPLSEVMGNQLTVSPGVVSSLSGLGGDDKAFTVSANVQPGNSGGPILNMRGQVIGVARAKLDEIEMLKAAGTTGGSVGFAINSATLDDFLRPFKTTMAEDIPGDDLNVEAVVERAGQSVVQIVGNGAAEANR